MRRSRFHAPARLVFGLLVKPSSLLIARSRLCLLLKTSLKRSPLRRKRSNIFLMVKSEIVTFLRLTSLHSSGAETVAPCFGPQIQHRRQIEVDAERGQFLPVNPTELLGLFSSDIGR